MKALTLWQPYATLIAFGAKKVETRGWAPPDPGPSYLAIHAAGSHTPAAEIDAAMRIPAIERFLSALQITTGNRTGANMPQGAIVAVVELLGAKRSEVLRQTLTMNELQMGNYEDGRYGWILGEVFRLPRPVHCRGFQKIWNVPDEVAVRVVGELFSCGRLRLGDEQKLLKGTKK